MKEKTATSGIRYVVSEVDLIKKREGLSTLQEVFRFLITEYIKLYRVEKPSVFIQTINDSYVGIKTKPFQIDESVMFSEPKNIAKAYQDLVDNFKGDNEDGEILMRKIVAEPLLGKWQKESLQKQLNSKALNSI